MIIIITTAKKVTIINPIVFQMDFKQAPNVFQMGSKEARNGLSLLKWLMGRVPDTYKMSHKARLIYSP